MSAVMKIKLKHLLYLLLIPLLLVFFWRTAEFWLNNRYGDVESAGALLYIALLGIEMIAAALVFFQMKYQRSGDGIHWLFDYRNPDRRIDQWIHWICFFWEAGMIVVLFYNHAALSHYMKCLAWPLMFESAYLLVKSDFRLFGGFRRVYWLLIALGAIVFLQAMQIKDFGGKTNMIYFLILPFPVIMCVGNVKFQYVIAILVSFLAVISVKRSMILAIGLFWLVVGFHVLFSKGKKTLAILLSVLMLGGGFVTYKVADKITGGYLTARLDVDEEEDVTSGRAAIYLTTWQMIQESSLDHLMLGHGHNAVLADSPLEKSAHNEWLEILYDYGILMMVLYIGLWVYLVRQWLYHLRNKTIFFLPYTLSLGILFSMSIVSQLVLYVSYFLYLVMFWAIAGAVTEWHCHNKPVVKPQVL